MNLRLLAGAGTLLMVLAGCAAEHAPPSLFPNPIALDGGDTLRLGAAPPGSGSGRIHTFDMSPRPDGATRIYAEVDFSGKADNFELWYQPGTRYAAVVAYYERHLGPPLERFERLVGECVVWEDEAARFELCRSRELEEHGEVIAHVYRR